MELQEIRQLAGRIKTNITKVIVGKEDTIELILISLICSGHVLIEDVPGVGKTMLAKCLARSIDCDFKRIQFTPDLLPSDITGINYYDQKQGEFVFRPGPLFANIILADEINRATPRTQSSLLECMEEGQVTVDGKTTALQQPFFVMATQNPVETRGTFPLPEAQLDRFLLRVKMGYPIFEEGKDLLSRFRDSDPFPCLESVASAEEVADARYSCHAVAVGEPVRDYIMNIIEKTRNHEGISLGASPRGSLALMRASQVKALLRGRDFTTPDDVKAMAIPVLAHRILLRGHALQSGTANASLLKLPFYLLNINEKANFVSGAAGYVSLFIPVAASTLLFMGYGISRVIFEAVFSVLPYLIAMRNTNSSYNGIFENKTAYFGLFLLTAATAASGYFQQGTPEAGVLSCAVYLCLDTPGIKESGKHRLKHLFQKIYPEIHTAGKYAQLQPACGDNGVFGNAAGF